jgi:hypothetical protein
MDKYGIKQQPYPLVSLLPVLFLLAGCASSFNFRSEKDSVRFDRAMEEGTSFIEPAGDLVAGEKLTYEVSWIGISVGQVIMENHGLETVGGLQAYHLTFRTLSNDFLSNFFHIEDVVHTWISRSGGFPVRFEKHIQEGHYSKSLIVEFDHERLLATYTKNDKVKTMAIPSDVQDIFSVLYWVRRQPLMVGRELAKDVNADGENWVMKVEVVEKGTFETAATGRVKAYALVPTAATEEKELEKGRGVVWMTADARRIPLAFQIDAKILGSINAVLSEAVLPPLAAYRFSTAGETEDYFDRVLRCGAWVDGLTQSARP